MLLVVTLMMLPGFQRLYAVGSPGVLLTVVDTLPKKSDKKKDVKKDVKKPEEKKKPTEYEKLFKDKAFETVKSNFITLHKIDNKLYFEFPLTYLGREMLFSSAPSATSNSAVADMGHKTMEHIRFTKEDSLICLRQVNTTTTYDRKEQNIGQAIRENTLDPVLDVFKIVAYNPDKSAVVFDVTSLFAEDNSLSSLFRSSISIFRLSGKVKSKMSVITSIKTFDDNLTVRTLMPHTVSLLFMGMTYAKMDVTVTATRSLLLLPEDKMRPRKSDSRVGIFLTNKEHYTLQNDGVESYSVAHRWRLEPKDEKAYKQGKLVEPKKPIVWYVDNAFPEEWKEPIRKAVLRWNASFEKIGFKNVMQVRDFPKDDPNFDPENLKYSCIRYLPTGIANAMGPSYVDPTTGEIMNASVLVYSNIVGMINNWRFIQTAQVDPSVRNKKMSKKIMDESIEYVVAHEIGHTLGFMHNMAASSAYPVDSLRSASFTQKYGTTPSIMDYARFNYVAQPGDKGVKLTPPVLGVYDDYMVKWNYQYFPGAKDMEEEAAILEKMVDEKAGDPLYRYGRQQIFSRYDPSALEEDLGDDPMKAGDYGIKNLQYILKNLDNWIKDDSDGTHKYALYQGIANQFYRYIRNTLYNIGGIYLTEVKDGTPGDRFRAVPRATQKASLKWALNHFKHSDWLNNKELTRKFPLGVNMEPVLQMALANSLKPLYKGVLLSSHISSDPYKIEEFFDDFYNLVFENVIKDRPLTSSEKMLQSATVDLITETFTEKEKGNGLLGITSINDAFAPSVDDIVAYGLDETGLVAQFAGKLREIEREQGIGSLMKEIDLESFGYGYGWQRAVSVTAIDNSKSNLHAFGMRIKRLLESKLTKASGETLAHYEALLFMLDRKLTK